MADVKYPQLYRNEDGVELEASNEMQAYVYEREGFKQVKPTATKSK